MLDFFVYGILLTLSGILISITRKLAFRNQELTSRLDIEVLRKLDEFEILPDLSEVKGIGPVYKELLKSSGIDDIYQLMESEEDALVENVIEVNRWGQYTKRTPSRDEILSWQQNAKNLVMEI
jgi:hypothetical protein